jgi:hypothetical protein
MRMPSDHEILKDWHEFYLLTGTAAAVLVALLFVAASIGAGFLPPNHAAASRVYMSPVVFHFTSVLFLSLVALLPTHAHLPLGILIGVNGGVGAVGSAIICKRVISHINSDWTDRIAYGAAPLVAYVAFVLAAVLLSRKPELAGDALAVAVVVLLLANIRNAWDLTLAMARRHSANKDDDRHSH